MRRIVISICVLACVFVTGCSTQAAYSPQWKMYVPGVGGTWQVNDDRAVLDSHSQFRWTIYFGTNSPSPNYTYWTTDTSWLPVSQRKAEAQLGLLSKSISSTHVYFYRLVSPHTKWVESPASLMGEATSMQNSHDGERIVRSIYFGSPAQAPIFVTSRPAQLTAITTNSSKQAVTFTWSALS